MTATETMPQVEGNPQETAAKPEKIPYNIPDGGLSEWPEDFDKKVHAPLKKKDFKDPRPFLKRKREEYLRSADRCQSEIDLIDVYGVDGAEDSKRLSSALSRLEEYISKLPAEARETCQEMVAKQLGMPVPTKTAEVAAN